MVLARLSGNHARELNELAPRLAQALERIKTYARDDIQYGGPMRSRPSALRDFTVDRRVWMLTGVSLCYRRRRGGSWP